MKDLLHNRKLLLLVVGITILILPLFILLWIPGSNKVITNPDITAPTPIPLENAVYLPGLQKTRIGETTTQDVEKIPGITKISDSQFTYPTYLNQRPGEIVIQNNVVSFERVLVPSSSSNPNYTTITKLQILFGEPEKITKGSRFYGEFLYTYIYASKGMTFIGNPNTDEVYEIQFYRPMPIQEYLRLFGSDVIENQPELIEKYN
jgi:hypothetical protein